MQHAVELIHHSLMITGFVTVMMMAVEYFNVLSAGALERGLRASRLKQYLLAAALGALPGCLGSMIVVTFYTHRIVSFGALMACMIATTGDESFVMLALFPGKALLLFAGLLLLGCDGQSRQVTGDGAYFHSLYSFLGKVIFLLLLSLSFRRQ